MSKPFIAVSCLVLGLAGGAYAQATFHANPLSLLKPKAVEALQAYQVAKNTGNELIEATMREKAKQFLPIDTGEREKLSNRERDEGVVGEVQPQGKPQAPEKTQ